MTVGVPLMEPVDVSTVSPAGSPMALKLVGLQLREIAAELCVECTVTVLKSELIVSEEANLEATSAAG